MTSNEAIIDAVEALGFDADVAPVGTIYNGEDQVGKVRILEDARTALLCLPSSREIFIGKLRDMLGEGVRMRTFFSNPIASFVTVEG